MATLHPRDVSVVPDAVTSIAREPTARESRLRAVPKKVYVGLGIVAFFVVVAVVAPLIDRYSPTDQNILNRLASPSGEHWLGTDDLGRDVWSRLVHATTLDLWLGFVIAFVPMVLGTLVGAIAGYYGRFADSTIMRTADVVQAFPIYIFMIAVVFALGAGVESIIVAFVAVSWVTYARIVRAEVLRVRESEYVLAARSGGLSESRVLFRHVLPNSINQTIVFFPADILIGVVSLGAFSFLGLGVQSPTPEWGAMIADGQSYIRTQWWLVTVPGLVIAVLGCGLMLIADGLDDMLRDQ
jgi:peptide/nickel transport system permease protein